ncbi:hypothetical protein [uncultured Thiodictyon sp.]|uniref:hypothetical protein n=1 Tax=uncultured Thiodictyon sp. TaxID=1846217 RepID=UPI0025DFE61C|nr:hypothetical protein [uncultured Thiodictyon sp.]
MTTRVPLVLVDGIARRLAAGDALASSTVGLGNVANQAQQFLHGFPNRTATTIAFNNTSRVFTLGVAVGVTATIYIGGVSYTLSNPGITVDLDDKTLSVGLWFIWAEVSGGVVVLNASKTSWNVLDQTKIPVALVYWNGAAGALQEERHSAYADSAWHQWAHETIGARIENDGSFSQTYPTTSVDGKIELVGGSLWDEDLETTVTTAQGKLIRNWYETAAAAWTFVDGTNNAGNDRPYIWNAGTSRLQYPKSNSSYALTDASSNDYIAVWVFASNDIDRPIYTVTQAKTAPYNTLALARNAVMPTLAFGPEMKLLYRWIYRGDGEYQEAVDYRTSSSLPGGGVTAPSASSVTAIATAPLTAGSVQGQLDEVAAIVGIDGLADIGAALEDGDELPIYDLSATALKKSALSRVWTYISGKLGTAASHAATDFELAQTAATQAEVEEGTEAGLRSLSPLRVKQAVSAAVGRLSFRNKIINGNFDIWQRGNGPFTANAAYTADRWKIFSLGSSFTSVAPAANTSGVPSDASSKAIVLTTSSSVGAANYAMLMQKIEGGKTLAGKTVTVSFAAKVSSGTHLLGVGLMQVFGSGGSPSASVVCTGVSVLLTTAMTTYSVTISVPSISGKTIGSDGNDYLELEFWFDAGSGVNARSGSVGQASGATFTITAVQVEEGSYATPFEYRPMQIELALCQRYYEKGYYIHQLPIANNVTFIPYSMPFKVVKRAAPSSVTKTSASFQNCTDQSNGFSDERFWQAVNVASGAPIITYVNYNWSVDVEL